MYRFRFSHFAVCLAVLACGISAGRVLFVIYGAVPTVYKLDGDFLTTFLNGFYSVLLPMIIMGTLSVTVYCAPVAAVMLFFRAMMDGHYLFSSVSGMVTSGVSLVGVFASSIHVFYTYGFLLLAMRCLGYRMEARQLPSFVSTLFRPEGRCFMRDYTSVAGVLTLGGLYSFTLMYFL